MSQTLSPFIRALAAGVRANVPTLIWGEPGQGETPLMTAAAEAWGLHLETITGSTREATDFLGVMVENKGVVSYSSFGWANSLNAAKNGCLLFLDELKHLERLVGAPLRKALKEANAYFSELGGARQHAYRHP